MVREGSEAVKEVLKVAEELTTKQKVPTVNTFLGMAQASARLEVMRCDGHIILEGGDDSWLGNNRIKMMVPCRFQYQVDLKDLRESDFRLDPARMILTVRMPSIQMEEPVPDRESLEVLEQINPRFRSNQSIRDLRDRVLSEQLKPQARVKGDEGIEIARHAGKAVLQDLLQRVYAPLVPEIKVIVQ